MVRDAETGEIVINKNSEGAWSPSLRSPSSPTAMILLDRGLDLERASS